MLVGKPFLPQKQIINVKLYPGAMVLYIKDYFDNSMFWNNMWVTNDKLHNGIVVDLTRQTRAKYHHICKMVLN